MSSAGSTISGCLSLIGFGVSIAAIVYVAKVYNNSSEDPFINRIIEKPEDYFSDIPEDLTENKFKCKCEQGVFDGRCNGEQKTFGCIDVLSQEPISYVINDINVINFLDESICQNYYKEIAFNKKKLDEVFNFNMSVIHLTSLLLLLSIVIIFAVVIVLSIIPCILTKCFTDPSNATCFICLVYVVSLILAIGEIAVFIILCINYYGGDSVTYGEFLECHNVKKEKFTLEFPTLEELRGDFTVLMVLIIISISLNLLIAIANKICPSAPAMGE